MLTYADVCLCRQCGRMLTYADGRAANADVCGRMLTYAYRRRRSLRWSSRWCAANADVCGRMLTYAYRRRRSLRWSSRWCAANCCGWGCLPQARYAYVSIRQHTSAYVSTRQHTSAHVSTRQHTSAYVHMYIGVPQTGMLTYALTISFGKALCRRSCCILTTTSIAEVLSLLSLLLSLLALLVQE
jgi:hypothetical protein